MKMTIRNPDATAFNIKDFTVDPKAKLLTCEASTLRLVPGEVGFQIYDDACDVGYAIRGAHHTTWFYETEEVKRDGDVLYWDYKPIAEHVRKNPAIAGWTLRIFND